ncbi:uncharacterized protein [Castor canadensis]|uniref:Uncharacterized protein n=1 Tax=Castor canadensis TaxID=51338 RepID=A0AC58MAL6_CASCN
MIRTENLEDDDDDEEQVPSELDPRNDDVLAEVQVGEVTQLFQQLQEERETYFSLNQHLKDLFIQKIPDNHQSQDHGEQLSEGSRLVEPFIYKKSAEVNSDASFQIRKPATKEGDTPEGSFENTRGIQDGFIDAASVLKEKIIKGKPLLSKWQITCRFPGPGYKDLNSGVCFEMKLEDDAPEGSVDHTPGFQHGLIDATNILKWKILKRKLLFSRCRIVCRFPELGQTGFSCQTAHVTSVCPYLEFPWASTLSGHPSPSPVYTVDCVPRQCLCPDALSTLGLNLDVCFEMKLEGDAFEGSVDHTLWFQHGLIDATNILKWKIVQRKLLYSRCRIVCMFPELEQTGLSCPTAHVSSVCPYLELPWASTLSGHPSPSPVCTVDCVPRQRLCPDTLSALELNSEACFKMNLEGDAPKSSVDQTPGFQHGLTDATSVLKWKILKRKLLLSMCRIVCRFPELGQTELNSGACSETELEGDAPEGSIDHTPEFQYCLTDATNILKRKLLKTKLLLSRCQIGCRFPELGQRGLSCITAPVISACSYCEFPWAATWSGRPSPSPVCTVNCVPTQHWCPNILSVIKLNLNAFLGMKQPPKVEGDVPEGSVDHAHGIHHSLIDAPNVLKQKVIKRILLLSKRRIESRFPGSTYRGMFCPTSDVISIYPYLGFLRTATLSGPPSTFPVCILNAAPPQCCRPHTLSDTDTKCCWNKKRY